MVAWVISVHISVISPVCDFNDYGSNFDEFKGFGVDFECFHDDFGILGDCNKCIESAFGDGSEICSISMISARISWILWLFEHFRCWFLRFQWILVFVSMMLVAILSLKSRW